MLNTGIGYYIPHIHVATYIHYMISVVDIPVVKENGCAV